MRMAGADLCDVNELVKAYFNGGKVFVCLFIFLFASVGMCRTGGSTRQKGSDVTAPPPRAPYL